MSRKIAIVAKGGTSSLAPWRDKEWEIWGVPWISYPRVDVLFDIHEDELTRRSPEKAAKDDEIREQVKQYYWHLPCYCPPSRAYAYGNPKPFPIDEIMARFPRPHLDNSIAYMIAFALMQDVEEIGLWGVHMVGRTELFWEKPSVTYWVGYAEGRGVKVTIPDGCPLFMSMWEAGRYGVNDRKRFISPHMGAL